jgi:hypothetical protein
MRILFINGKLWFCFQFFHGYRSLQSEEKYHHNIEDRIRELELCNRKLEFENYELNEKNLEIQTHSMRYNLIVVGIKSEGAIENTENVVKQYEDHYGGCTDDHQQ